MNGLSRREFLKSLVAALGFAAVAPNQLFAQARRFEFLVVGDSLVWGQGLEEKDKFYSLTAEWLRREVFAGRREVTVKVKAHSGATYKFSPEHAAAYRKAGRNESYPYPGEINNPFPSMWNQLDTAAAEYKAAGVASGADLIMLTGGITDPTVEEILDPSGNDAGLPALIEKYCRDGMVELLEHAAALNPSAMIAVVGYFPMISEKSSASRVFNALLVMRGYPSFVRYVTNNPVVRRLVFQKLRKKAIKRSRIWMTESNRNFQIAVDSLNAKLGRKAAVFVPSSLTEDNAAEAPNTKLFRMRKNGVVEDPLFERRKADCKTSLTDLKRATGIDRPLRPCVLAGVGHPDAAGARAYAEAIKTALAPLIH